MILRFPYKLVQMGRPIPSLGGRTVRPRSRVLVHLAGPVASTSRYALLDTGADDTIFPDTVAALLGVDLDQAPIGSARGISTGSINIKYATVSMRLHDGHHGCEWPAMVGFTSGQINVPLLGFAGCLQFFTATFHGDREEVELAVNALYPGT
jgi:hypothetical protein